MAGLQRGGLLAYCGCHLPLEDSWWARLLWEGAPHTVRGLSRHADLELVHVEEHPPAGVQYPDYIPHLMALFSKR
ncbi:MAG: hypothetical protein JO247_23275 [Chloroflexi bacterium]|nr:hypothetical protein [Chloroflexota bacterium]